MHVRANVEDALRRLSAAWRDELLFYTGTVRDVVESKPAEDTDEVDLVVDRPASGLGEDVLYASIPRHQMPHVAVGDRVRITAVSATCCGQVLTEDDGSTALPVWVLTCRAANPATAAAPKGVR